MQTWKKVVISSVLFSTGLGVGFTASLVIMIRDEPTVIVRDRWRIVTTATTVPVGHTSLNEDELRNILRLEKEADDVVAGVTTTTTILLPPPAPAGQVQRP